MQNYTVNTKVKYRPCDEDIWYIGTIERDCNGVLYIKDSTDEAVCFYPDKTDEVIILE